LNFFKAAKKMRLEGIIAKKSDSTYSPGNRSGELLKVKANKRQEMVIGGYTKNDDSSKSFSSLLLGVFEKGKLIYTGKVGPGFNDKQQKEMLKQFKPHITNSPPFTEMPDINKPSRFRPDPPHAVAVWMKPELVYEVSFAEMTTDGIMRHPSFEAILTLNLNVLMNQRERQLRMKILLMNRKLTAFIINSPTFSDPIIRQGRPTPYCVTLYNHQARLGLLHLC